MDITIVTTAHDNDTGKALLEAFGFPFKKGADADERASQEEEPWPVRYGGKKK